MSSGITASARRRATLAACVFAASGVAGLARSGRDALVPLVAFYAVLVLNTWFSVRCFASVAPLGGRFQRTIDAILVAIYVLLSGSFAHPTVFVLTATLLFVISILKYVDLLERGVSLHLLARKLSTNAVGGAACLTALGFILAGHVPAACWALAAASLAANVVLLWLRPLYRIEAGAR